MKGENLCVFCEHINMNTIGCFGEYPDPATFECTKGHWQGIDDFPGKFREQILVAKSCPDFTLPAPIRALSEDK